MKSIARNAIASVLVLLASLFTLSSSMAAPKPKIFCVGLSAVDFVATVDHFPEPDEKMRSSSLIIEGGGNAANSACAMGRLSEYVDVSLVTGVGDDANGNTIVDSITSNGVKVIAEEFPGSSPFSYILNADIDGENTRTCIHQPAAGDMTVEFVEKLSLDGVDAVHFDCRYPTAAMALAKRCMDAGIPYSVDVERPREGLLELLANATVVICNSIYCNTILGDMPKKVDYKSSSQRLRKVMDEQAPNAKIIVGTLGSKGSFLLLPDDKIGEKDGAKVLSCKDKEAPTVTVEGDVLCCPTFKNVKVVDSTGSGDAFIGGFLTAFWTACQGNKKEDTAKVDVKALARALRVATRVAGKKIEKPGARQGLPRSDDTFLSSEMGALQSKPTPV